jgi:hypothetical protein
MESLNPDNLGDVLNLFEKGLGLGEEAPITTAPARGVTLYQSIVENRDPVLLVGESPIRALTMSLALLRGSFKGIWSTSYDGFGPWCPKDLWKALSKARDHAVNNERGISTPTLGDRRPS